MNRWSKLSICLYILFSLLFLLAAGDVGAGEREALPGQETLRRWVAEMKISPRGPFQRIRWFCKDGTIHPPAEYTCRDRGGGVQHGEWTERVVRLRSNGYFIANVFADVRPEILLAQPDAENIVKQMILEQYLIRADDGWILRHARYYRGALQDEDESRSGQGLLLAMVSNPAWQEVRFPVLREAVRFIPHGRFGAPISEMRQLSRALGEADPEFQPLRIKIHVKPDLGDAERVRRYGGRQGKKDLAGDYEKLALLIQKVFQPSDARTEILALNRVVSSKILSQEIREIGSQLGTDRDPAARFEASCRMLASIRGQLRSVGDRRVRLALLDASLTLEQDLFLTGAILIDRLPRASRRERVEWLKACANGLYGMGLISGRQREGLLDAFQSISSPSVRWDDYKAGLSYAARIPGWTDQNLRFHFTPAVDTLTVLEPLTSTYLHDRVRGSLLIVYSSVLEGLLADANRQLGVVNRMMDRIVDAGLTALNPGITRGVVRVAKAGDDPKTFSRDGIYVLPETVEDLPSVRGIITAGKGNMLSHVQLLARHLGIPNVAVDQSLLPQISGLEGRSVVLAVSPGGIVQIAPDGPEWDAVFAMESQGASAVIRPTLEKLDLSNRNIVPLGDLRFSDSGRICGPKAANLAELKRHFPEAVAEGLVIPFGIFRSLLDHPVEPGGLSMFQWMQRQNTLIKRLAPEPAKQQQAIERFLDRMRRWITSADPGIEFRAKLRAAMEKAFGPDGSYGVFVRSDTNVEDLPGFTGAGLNLTVPNVVGFDGVMEAILRVWASPFADRAYHWRQASMDQPEQVYVSILLLKSVPVEKSGVMVTTDVETGTLGWLSVAVSEGVGGAVSGQRAEELRINPKNDQVHLLAHATEPFKRILEPKGGVVSVPASGTEAVLSRSDITQLMALAGGLLQRFPWLKDKHGHPVPADVEFGFARGQLHLFQIRPYLESSKAKRNRYLWHLDEVFLRSDHKDVDLGQAPKEK
jgi:phosphohistidine swiveling domain-containing protein